MNHPFHLAVLLAFTLPAHSLTVRGYNATDHDRFTGFPASPVMNPGFLYDATKYTGVGWWTYVSGTYGTIHSQITAVSPRHLVCAAHARPSPGVHPVHFIDSTGALVTRTVSAFANVPNDDASASADLCVITLATPLPDTVAPFPWLNLTGGEAAYLSQELQVLGQTPNGTPRGGRASLSSFETYDISATITDTRCSRFLYSTLAGLANDCFLTPGDSGGPSFADVGGQPALVSTHIAAIENIAPGQHLSIDTFLPHYVERVDEILEPAGHRLVPVNFTPTTLAIPSAAASPATLRRLNPGSVGFSVANTGGALTGNLAVTITFPAGEEPDSLTAPGWVVESGGTGVWHLRAATLAAAASLSFTANWSALPDLAAVGCTIAADSDTAAAVNAAPSFPLAPSYAAWAAGLAQPGQTADPDADALENLFEYALGGDPESGSMLLPGDHPLRPQLAESGGTVFFSFPERDDALLRGLSYVVETSTDLESPSWSATLPPGNATTTAPFAPDVPGFLKRTVTWPADGLQRFVRVKVELAE